MSNALRDLKYRGNTSNSSKTLRILMELFVTLIGCEIDILLANWSTGKIKEVFANDLIKEATSFLTPDLCCSLFCILQTLLVTGLC